MRKHLFFLLLLSPLWSFAQNIDSAWIVDHYIKKERYVPMRDKARLFTSIYMPIDSLHDTHPVLLLRTPYSCAPYGIEWIPFWKVYVKEYLKEGYIVVFQDVRGRYMSEGDFINIRPFNPNKKTDKEVDEASDAYDTIDWLIKNIPGNNGNVGAIGTSYGGFYTTMAGLSGHKSLKAISPQAPVTDWFAGDDAHHNGAFMLMDMFDFFVQSGFGVTRHKPSPTSPSPLPIPTDDAYQYYLRTGPLSNFSKIAADRNVPFWDDFMQHQNYDNWWNARNPRNYVDKIPNGMATLVVGGLFDAEDCFGAINLYQAIESKAKNNNKFVLGPWSHGQWGSGDGTHLGHVQFGSNTSDWYVKNIELPFFNYYLKGSGSVDSITEVTVFFTGENQWHKLKKWPLDEVQQTGLYFKQGGKLSFTKPQTNNGYEEYISDPAKPVPYTEGIHRDRTREFMSDDQRFAASRKDVLTFKTEVLDKDITLAGPLKADLMVSISTTDADLVLKLIDVFPDDFKYNSDGDPMNGYQMLVRGEVLRGRYRNSLSLPEAFVPGKVSPVKYTLNDVAHTFKKGHRIMVQIQSSWFPIVDRNPQQFVDIYHAKETDFIKSKIRIHMSSPAASKIWLPVVHHPL